MSSIQPILPGALDLKPTFGWFLIGDVCSAAFYGVTVLQMLFYFQTYPNDRPFLKYLVTGIWILDTLSLIFISHGTYTWLVIDFADPLALNSVPWTIASEPLCSASVALIAQSFMAYRIYVLEPKLMILSIAIVLAACCGWGTALAAVVTVLTTPGFAAINRRLHGLAIVGGVLEPAIDIVIAVTLITLLHRRGQGVVNMKGTDRIISTLTVYLITSNILTSFFTATSVIVFFAAPKRLVYEGFNSIITRAYANTFLSQLNVRESIRGRGTITTHSGVTGENTKPVAFNYESSTPEELSKFEAAVTSTSDDNLHIESKTMKNA